MGGHDHHENINIRGAIVHVIGDLVQSIGVAIAGCLIWIFGSESRWYYADPICTFIFAGLVMLTTRALIKDMYRVLMEGAPEALELGTIQSVMASTAGVQDVHDLHVWDLTTGVTILTAHVRTRQGVENDKVLH